MKKQDDVLWLSCLTQKLTNGKDLDAQKDWGQEETGATKDEMVGWHHWLNGHEFEKTPGDGEGQGNPRDCKESDTAEQLNNSNGEEGHWRPARD